MSTTKASASPREDVDEDHATPVPAFEEPLDLMTSQNLDDHKLSFVVEKVKCMDARLVQDQLRHGSQIRQQLPAASLTNRSHPKIIITKVIIKLKLWLAAGCEVKVVAELNSLALWIHTIN